MQNTAVRITKYNVNTSIWHVFDSYCVKNNIAAYLTAEMNYIFSLYTRTQLGIWNVSMILGLSFGADVRTSCVS